MKTLMLILAIAIILVSCKCNKPEEKENDISSAVVINQGNVDFNTFFLNKTMRVDYYHTGNNEQEMFAVDKVLNDGEWAGSQTVLIDQLELGLYFYEVIDKESKVLMYSRGFASIFGEWQTIPEAKEKWGSFHESLRFPWPLKPVTIIIKKRDDQNKFQSIWTTDIDPAYRQVIKEERKHDEPIFIIADHGSANEKLDIVILGDGYTATEMEKFRSDAKRLSNDLLNAEPFLTRAKDINIKAVETPAFESGVTKPHHGIYKSSPLSVQYSSFDSERYALSYDNKTIRNIASAVPYDFMVIIMNERTYGGGGIYMLYTTLAADNAFSGYTMIHEMGHHMAALADEYYTSAVSYEIPEITVEPWETNATALFDKNNLKWKDLVEEGTPIPTPWSKGEFDTHGYAIQNERDSLRANHYPESVVEELFKRQLKAEDEFFAKEQYKNKVGAFEGSNYQAKGLYRPQLDCIMYTRHNVFCKVCQRSIVKVIDQYSK